MVNETSMECLRVHMTKVIESMKPNERDVLYRQVLGIIDAKRFEDVVEGHGQALACPECGGEGLIKYGKTAKGTQRYQCRDCGKVHAHLECGTIMRNTKLPRETWYRFAKCFVNGFTVSQIQEECEVSRKTAWFMRTRMMEAVSTLLPSFELKSGVSAQFDEIYFRESFKGMRFSKMENPPREVHKRGESNTRGIGDELVCVLTGINDNDDIFYEVCCRGSINRDAIVAAFSKCIHSGAIVNTDRHCSYSSAMSTLGSIIHKPHHSTDHAPLNRVNSIHSHLREMIDGRFRGVSTKWLPYYVGYYEWMREFSNEDSMDIAARTIWGGDYSIRWRGMSDMKLLFRGTDSKPVKF